VDHIAPEFPWKVTRISFPIKEIRVLDTFDPASLESVPAGADSAGRLTVDTSAEMDSPALLVITAIDSPDLARQIAEALVEQRLAACVNMVSGVRSVYRWEGELKNGEEILLLIKTTTERFQDLSSVIHRLHSYQVPEILAVPVDRGDPAFLSWLLASVEPADPS
jgi:periplasmic divalent cation tolerance protein